MRQRSCAMAACIIGAVIGIGRAFAESPGDKQANQIEKSASVKDAADGVFGLTKVHTFHLKLTAAEWDKLPPKGGGFPFGPRGGPGANDKPVDKLADTHRGSGFGMEFPWVKGELTAGGKTYANIGIRYKGNASYMTSSRGLKRNFKIELDHYGAAQRFHGLKTLNLNAGAMDPTKMREALSFAVYRAAGVPAPRTAYAEVTLSVPGKYDQEFLGLYTVIEQVDKTFLQSRFKNANGLLMKPEGVRGIDYLGDDWVAYKGRYRPKHEPSEAEARRVIDFARLVNNADDVQFPKEIGSYLDVEEFLRFVAATALVVNLDNMFVIGHNYFLYLNPKTNKFVFIPWDMDLSLAGFPMAGSPEQQVDLSLTHPHPGENKLLDRLLAVKEISNRYQELLKEISADAFGKEQLLKDIEAIEKVTKPVLARETKAAGSRNEGAGAFGFGPPGGGPFGTSLDPRTFVEKRTASVADQLAGKSKGYTPAGMGFGPGGFRGGGFGPGNFLAKPLMTAIDTDKDGKVSKAELIAATKKFFADCDKHHKGSLDEKQIAEWVNRVMPRPEFGRPPGGPPPGGDIIIGGPFGPPAGGPPGDGPRGGLVVFGPGNQLAGNIIKRADANRNGKVTLDELLAAAETFFKEADKDKNGTLDEKELTAAINLLAPPPPGFGPPPGGHGAERKDLKKEDYKP